MSTRWLVLVESNTTGSGREFCSVARARGLRPVVLAADPARYPYLLDDAVDCEVLDTADPAEVISVCRSLGAEVAGVTSSSDHFVAQAATAAVALNLPGPDPASILRCRAKDQQREALLAAGLPVPAFGRVRDVAGAVRLAEWIGLPVVVKPVTGSGSVGVRRCADVAEVADQAGSLLAMARDERNAPVPRAVLVEALATGPEYSVETFGQRVVAVVAKHLGRPPHFVETGHDLPAELAEPARAELAGCALAALRALGLGFGAAHTELRLTPAGPVVIEVNPRLAGGMIPELVRLATGVDLVAATVCRVTGTSAELTATRHRYASIRFVLAPWSGTITLLSGLAGATALDGVERAAFTVRVGEQITISHSFRDRIGHLIATADDAATARQRAEQAAGQLRVCVLPSQFPPGPREEP